MNNTKMAAIRRKQDDKNLETLRELITNNGNKYCLDCNQRGPTYVNTTIGSFVCSKCSGMLRGLTPPHRVKSISMATFTPEEIEFIKSRGNDYCRRLWLGLHDGESSNFTDEQSVKDFMSDKYEKKRYYLESQANKVTTNGNGLSNGKPKSKTGSSANPTPLISISPQVAKIPPTTSMSRERTVPALPTLSDASQRSKPINDFTQPFNINMNTVPTSNHVPDFPVDFSTADIYNSSQVNITNNNFPSKSSSTFSAFSPPSSSNDRYAALADLDVAFRQQNLKVLDETNVNGNKNPFQSTSNNDLFSDRNPFFNGGWNPTAAPVPQPNPFVSAMNNGSYGHSKNPFL